MKMAINRCKKQDGEYRFTELLRGLHPDFTRVTHTASRQWFGAGRGQGEKSRSGNRLDADRCHFSCPDLKVRRQNCSVAMERHNASMPNIASILKAEISRVARKEVRAEIETLKKASVAHRASIAELRRQVNALEKELRRVAKSATRSTIVPDSANEAAEGTKRRFSATRLAAHRAKLGLSAASYGQLVGVSGQTIYHWEQGKARPRAAQLENLAAVRDLGAREVSERLAES
jgi:DNA-binding transcriptional regulator YiaG